MTLTLAWTRQKNDTEELLIASDSRLRFGEAFDACPKLFLTPRGDIAFGFAGDTMIAYPLLTQIINHMTLHRASMTREHDIYKIRGHVHRVFQGMLNERRDPPTGEESPDPPDASFVMAGYSWKRRAFAMWHVRYDMNRRSFVWTRRKRLDDPDPFPRLVILGDPSMSDRKRRECELAGKTPPVPASDDVKKIAAKRIAQLLAAQTKDKKSSGLDMEPFEVLCSMIREDASPYVGGPPQMIKMYPSCSSQVIGVLWPDEKNVAVLGRPLLSYERLTCPVIDSNSLHCSFGVWPPNRGASCRFADD